jgi:hypothetical protein
VLIDEQEVERLRSEIEQEQQMIATEQEQDTSAGLLERVAQLEQSLLLFNQGATPDFGDLNHLENRLDVLEQSFRDYQAQTEQRIAALEQAVERLTVFVSQARIKMLRPPHAEYSASSEEKPEEKPITSTLQDGLVIATAFAKQHGIAESTLKRVMNEGRLHAVSGSWLVGRTTVKWALDAPGRAQFYQMYHNHPKFIACPTCPHGIE